jgi:hypothetical protein
MPKNRIGQSAEVALEAATMEAEWNDLVSSLLVVPADPDVARVQQREGNSF